MEKKKFGGKYYTLYVTHQDKKSAEKYKKKAKDKGELARTEKVKTSWGNVSYSVWTRKK